MVYESDFYTTRRPYSRPLVSSYTVTPLSGVVPLSTIIQLRSGHPRMPYIAHKRLVTVIHTPIRTVYHHGTLIPIRIHARVRPSVLAAELNRIRALPRPSTESYIEKFLNSRDCIYFDDEAREIRARVDSLLRRVHVFVPRASPSDFLEEIIPERMHDDCYIRRLISGKSNAKKEADPVSWYDVPERGSFGNLSCVKYVAGKPHSIRRPYYKVADLRPSDIKNDVNFLSYYKKNLQAAEHAFADQPMTERELRKARALETEWSEQQRQKESKAEPVAEVLEESEKEVVREIVAEKVDAALTNGEAAEAEGAAPEAEAVSERKKKKKEKKQEEKDVKNAKEEALKRAEAFLIKQTAADRMAEEKRYFEEMRRLQKEREENDARLTEERQRAIDEERAKLELEEQKAWLAMKEAQEAKARILERHENERLEVLRKAEEEKEEKDRLESRRVAEEEKREAATALAAAIEEEERIAAEGCLEERAKRATEDRLAEIATVEGREDPRDFDKSLDEPLAVEDTDQEKEEQPYEIINVEEARIEPDQQQEDRETKETPFVEEVDDVHEAGDAQRDVSAVVEDHAVTEEVWPSGEESAPAPMLAAAGEEAMPAEEVCEESQEEAAPAEETDEGKAAFDGTQEETIVTDGGGGGGSGGGGEEPATVQDEREEEEAAAAEDKEEVEETAAAPLIEDSIPADEIEETFEWGEQDS